MAKRNERTRYVPAFAGVDSEGITTQRGHRAVLLSVGRQSYVARDKSHGLHWKEVFSFLYQCYEADPKPVYIGFYLSYDFNCWLHTLPEKQARQLLTIEGITKRKIPDHKGGNKSRNQFYPVRCEDWEFDMLGFKQLKIRPRTCRCYEQERSCYETVEGKRRLREGHPKPKSWMYISDGGPFFQMPFLGLLAKWDSIRTEDEYQAIKEGKDKRATARLNKKMVEYNVLENVLLAKAMRELAEALKEDPIGISPNKTAWYGPGSLANIWLRGHGAIHKSEIAGLPYAGFFDLCRKSYYGGWFEIFSHGYIRKTSHNYDINSAYPATIARLPHICESCGFQRRKGRCESDGEYVLLLATVRSCGTRIGGVPFRDSDGSILRPSVSKGWYWKREIDAGIRAGIIDPERTVYHEWAEFTPCSDDKPFAVVADLYKKRQQIKAQDPNHPMAMAIKLLINSLYGKFAQSVGAGTFNNWFYASYITSQCRTQILDAIAAHPRKADAVLMVATDGICFDSPCDALRISPNLGDWEHTEYDKLVLFKPGVYWHTDGKRNLEVKSRGVSKKEFSECLEDVELTFKTLVTYGEVPKKWPIVEIPVEFRMKSCKQALNEGHWERAATLAPKELRLKQDSNPWKKRSRVYFNATHDRIDSLMHHRTLANCQTTYYKDAPVPEVPDYGVVPGYGSVQQAAGEMILALHDKGDIPPDNEEVMWE